MRTKRQQYIDECSGFGYDEDDGTGLDETTETCRACRTDEPERFAACKAEVETARGQASNAEEVPVTPDAPAANPAPKTVKKAKEKGNVEKKVTVMDVIVEALKSGPKKPKDILALIEQAGFAKAAAKTQLYCAVAFGKRVGVIVESEQGVKIEG